MNFYFGPPRFRERDLAQITIAGDPFRGQQVQIKEVRPTSEWPSTTEPSYQVTLLSRNITFPIDDSALGPL